MIYLGFMFLCPNLVSADGSVRILTNPEDAEVLVDRELKAINTPVSIKLPNGRYRITVRYKEDSRWFDVLITDGITILKEFDFNASDEKEQKDSLLEQNSTLRKGLRHFFSFETGKYTEYEFTAEEKKKGRVQFIVEEKSSTKTEDTYKFQMNLFSVNPVPNRNLNLPEKRFRFSLMVGETIATVTDLYSLPNKNNQVIVQIPMRIEISEAEVPLKKHSKFLFTISTNKFSMSEYGQVISDSTEVVAAGGVMKNVLKAKLKCRMLDKNYDSILFFADSAGPVRLDSLIDERGIIQFKLSR